MLQYVKELPESELTELLTSQGLPIKIGPFNFLLSSNHTAIVKPFRVLYGNHKLLSKDDFVDFNIYLKKSTGIRRWFKPQIEFFFDDQCPFKPLSLREAFPLLEWSMNWCIGAHAHQYLIIHSAVLKKNDAIVILPGAPGSGKSTLCAALMAEGYQVLSDELALFDRETGLIDPVCRPISLKNKSIDVITERYPSLSPASNVRTENKGYVAHFPTDVNIGKLCQPRFVVFPKYKSGAPFSQSELSKAECFLKCVEDSFNYNHLGSEGFDAMSAFISNVDGYTIEYDNLDDAIAFINAKVNSD
ncbi:HprK-related kinase A [Thalassotalea euphylliae]|uniref:HprK-related kinase A n=1 Tax=Thalassotalea euphylliae TaxID=1655234 RepID=UPI00363E7B98